MPTIANLFPLIAAYKSWYHYPCMTKYTPEVRHPELEQGPTSCEQQACSMLTDMTPGRDIRSSLDPSSNCAFWWLLLVSCQLSADHEATIGTVKAYLIQKLRADHLAPAYAETQWSAWVAQIRGVKHQLQHHITVLPHSQVWLLARGLAESSQQAHVLRHVCC